MDYTILNVASKAVEYFIDPLFRQVGYVLLSEQYVSSLEDGIREIEDERKSIEHTIEDARRTEEGIIESKVSNWSWKAEKLKKDADKLVKKKAASFAFAGFVVNPKTRHHLGRKAKHALEDIQSHLKPEKKTFDRLFYTPTRPEGIASETPSQGILELDSRQSMLEDIMKSLADDTVSRVGVYGDGGVGKTTLLSRLETRAKEDSKEYIEVVTAFVSQNPKLESIRVKISDTMDRVKTILNNEKPERQEESNKKESKKKRVVLVILDDLWKKLNLADIGVTDMKDISKDKIVIKLVMTSRNPNVLSNGMRCQQVFQLKGLGEEESWKLFYSGMDNNIINDSIHKKAKQLFQKYDGLPLFINALSKELRNCSSPEDWDDALDQFKNSDSVQNALEQRFHNLQERQFRLLSIVLSIDGTDGISHEALLRYSVGLDLVEGGTMGGCRSKLRVLLDGLRASSWLLDSGNECVRVHDLVREAAINLAVRNQHTSVYRVEKDLEGCKVKLCESKGIFLPYPNIQELPCLWNCPELEIIVLFAQEDRLLQVPYSFFKLMPRLKVMHFSHTCLKPLPRSILRLKNLQTLCLEYCDLEDISFVKELKNLQVLSFKGSNIIRLPKEIGQLVGLLSLDLSHCMRLEVVESGLLEGLCQLEELYLENSFTQWSLGDAPRGNSSLSVLNKLPRLRNIDMLVPDVDMLQEDLPFFEKLDKYRVLVGDTRDWSEIKKGQRTLKVKLDGQCIMSTEWLQLTLQRTEDLQIHGSVGTKRSIQGLCIRGFNELKSLHVQNNHSVHSLVDSTGNAAAEAAFPMLESVFLENLSNLQSIWRGPSDTGRECFKILEVVKVHNCWKLKSLLSVSLLGELKKLNEIEVIGCSVLQEIFIYESPREDDKKEKSTKDDKKKISVELPSLRHIKLRDLPNITRLLTIKDPNQPDRSHGSVAFFNGQVSLPCLESLEIDNLPKMKEIWKGHSSAYWSKLKSLKIKNCNNVVKAIDSSSILKLSGLESLEIEDCESMEEVFDARGMEVSAGGKVKILPSLRVMELKWLPRLRSLWDSTSSGLQNLESLNLRGCVELKYLFTSSMCKAMGNLKELRLTFCRKLESIVMVDSKHRGFCSSNAENIIKLPSLRVLSIDSCYRMKSFAGSFREREGPTVSDEEDISSVLFGSEVHLPSLEVLVVSLATFKKIWHDKLNEESFCKLTSVYLFSCDDLSVVFPSAMMERLNHLRSVEVNWCESITTIFGHVLWDPKKRLKQINLLPELKELTLSQLKSLTHVVEKANSSRRGESVSVGFPSLTKLDIKRCDKLEYVFPSAIARTLSKLEEASIAECRHMREVIMKEEGEGEPLDELTFPCLSSLQFYDLDSLICFTAMSCSFYFPYAEDLIIKNCDHMKTFVGTTTHSENPAFFNNKVELPKLAKLKIEKPGFTEFSNNQIPPWFLQNLRQLELVDPSMSCYLDPSTSFAKKLLQQLETFHLQGRGNELSLRMLSQSLTSLEIVNCHELTNLFTTSQVKCLRHLQHLKVEDCIYLQYVVVEEETGDHGCGFVLFPSLTSLELQKLPDLFSFHKNSCASGKDMDNVHHQTQQSLFWVEQVSFPCLEKLVISRIDKIEKIWYGQVAPGGFRLQKLSSLRVNGCRQLVCIFPSPIAESLPKLMELEILDSGNLQAVVKEDEMINDRELVFSHLTHIKLKNLLKLKSFNSCRRITQFPMLRELTVEKAGSHVEFLASVFDNSSAPYERDISAHPQSLFLVDKASFPCLEILNIWKMERLRQIVQSDVPVNGLLEQLRELKVQECLAVEVLFPTDIVHTLRKLQELEVESCSSLRVIYDIGGPISTRRSDRNCKIGSQMKELTLESLPKLEHIIWDTAETTRIVSFFNLTKVKVESCGSLTYLFPLCVAKVLYNLEVLEISSSGLEEVVSSTSEEMNDVTAGDTQEFVFPRARWLKLSKLRRLTCFYRGKHISTWPSLATLVIDKCYKIQNLYGEVDWLQGAPDCVGTLFSVNKDSFLCFVSLSISCMDSLTTIWSSQEESNLFSQLTKLNVEECNGLVNIFPPGTIHSFTNLQSLRIRSCSALKFVYEIEENVRETPTKLKDLVLEDLAELQHIWSKDPIGVLGLHNLSYISVNGCKKLTYLFHASVAKALIQLVELKITDSNQEFVFPHATRMDLSNLPCLKSFYPGKHISRWPKLEVLTITNCNAFDVFAFDSKKIQAVSNSSTPANPTEPPLFLVDKKTFPNLETVKLENNNMKHIWGRLQRPKMSCFSVVRFHFANITTLEVVKCHFLSSILTPRMAAELPRLAKLNIKDCDILEAIITIEEKARKCTAIKLGSLQEVILESLPKLASFCPHTSFLDCTSLTTLKISGCHEMKTFIASPHHKERTLQTAGEANTEDRRDSSAISAPPEPFFNEKVSFPCLKKLVISCIQIVCIFHALLADRLPKLMELEIQDSENLEVVVMENEMFNDRELVFPLLTCIRLKNLPKLKSFHSGRHITQFPLLRELTIDMAGNHVEFLVSIFDNLSAPSERDVSAHPQSLFLVDKASFHCLEILNITKMERLRLILQCNVPGYSLLKQLRELKVDQCVAVETLFPNDIVHTLQKLQRLFVKSCSSLRVIYDTQELISTSRSDQNFMVENPTKLKVVLDDLTELQHIWSKDPRGVLGLHNLSSVSIKKCEKLSYLFHASVAEAPLQLVELEIIDSNLEVIITDHGAKVNGTVEFVFPHAAKMKLSNLPCLKSFYPGEHISRWPKLRELTISNCNAYSFGSKKFQAISESSSTANPADEQPLFLIDKGTFPYLKTVKLQENNMKQMWSGWQSPQLTCFSVICFNFANITTLEVVKCHFLSNILTPSMAVELPRLAKLEIKECDGLEAIITAEEKARKCTAIKLRSLQEVILESLPKLASFCPHTLLLECPSLTTLDISGCHEMKTFIASPHHKERTLKTEEEENTEDHRDSDDISIPTGPFFNEQILFPGLKKLAFSQMDSLKMIWHDQLLAERSFDMLKDVEIKNCKELTRVIYAKVLERFMRLEKLSIYSCDKLEVVFDVPESRHDRLIRMSLKELNLSDLPQLRSLCSGDTNGIISFEDAMPVQAIRCPNLENFGRLTGEKR